MARTLATVLDEKQARDILIMDVRGQSSVTDFHILATGTSSPHLRALIGELQQRLKAQGAPSYRKSGTPDSGWVVLDFVEAVVHAFTAEARAYYDLEALWKDAKRITLEDASAAPRKAARAQ
ncbi:MAG: ribosome silencing factor [Kiritimatiellae bacterium]|nr:ribosome silencing factor [Kiritimatiellia bacterium]